MGFINQLIVGLLWGKKRCPSKNIIDHTCTVGVPYLTSCSNIFNIIIYKHIFQNYYPSVHPSVHVSMSIHPSIYLPSSRKAPHLCRLIQHTI